MLPRVAADMAAVSTAAASTVVWPCAARLADLMQRGLLPRPAEQVSAECLAEASTITTFHHRHFRNFVSFGIVAPYAYADYPYDDCYDLVRVRTYYGWRWRRVSVCG